MPNISARGAPYKEKYFFSTSLWQQHLFSMSVGVVKGYHLLCEWVNAITSILLEIRCSIDYKLAAYIHNED